MAPNAFAGSVLNLQPGTEYEVHCVLTDPDGLSGAHEQTVTVRTRTEPMPANGGTTYHVYPANWQGAKQEPSFVGLLAAYYSGQINGDLYNSFPVRVKPGDTILVHAGVYDDMWQYYMGAGNERQWRYGSERVCRPVSSGPGVGAAGVRSMPELSVPRMQPSTWSFENGARVEVAYFLMSEDNLRRQISLPWVSFGSDAAAPAPEGVFLKSSAHPRAYGNFSRLLAKYVRDEKVISVQEAVRRLTALPAANLSLPQRGSLRIGYYADIVIFDPQKIQDHATFQNPHQLSTGVDSVWVNGKAVLLGGIATGSAAGPSGPRTLLDWRSRRRVPGKQS
jgi:hypothetical protein